MGRCYFWDGGVRADGYRSEVLIAAFESVAELRTFLEGQPTDDKGRIFGRITHDSSLGPCSADRARKGPNYSHHQYRAIKVDGKVQIKHAEEVTGQEKREEYAAEHARMSPEELAQARKEDEQSWQGTWRSHLTATEKMKMAWGWTEKDAVPIPFNDPGCWCTWSEGDALEPEGDDEAILAAAEIEKRYHECVKRGQFRAAAHYRQRLIAAGALPKLPPLSEPAWVEGNAGLTIK